MATPNPAAGLLAALKSLRRALAADSPPFPGVVNDPRQTNFPQVAAVDLARRIVHNLLWRTEKGSCVLNDRLASEMELDEINRFVLNVGNVDRLPAPPFMLRKLDGLIEDLGGPERRTAGKAPKPLPDTQQRVYDVIAKDGPIMGAAICRQVGIEQASLTALIIPALKKSRGVKNQRGAGYYVETALGANR